MGFRQTAHNATKDLGGEKGKEKWGGGERIADIWSRLADAQVSSSMPFFDTRDLFASFAREMVVAQQEAPSGAMIDFVPDCDAEGVCVFFSFVSYFCFQMGTLRWNATGRMQDQQILLGPPHFQKLFGQCKVKRKGTLPRSS
jgi:hypothetical protein